MNIYKKHETKDQELYKKIKEIIEKIHIRYQDPHIIIGGDMNIQDPVRSFENIRL